MARKELYKIQSGIFQTLYKCLWNFIKKKEFNDNDPEGVRTDFGPLVFDHETKSGLILNDWLLSNPHSSKRQNPKYLYKKYLESQEKDEISFDEVALFNILYYMEYRITSNADLKKSVPKQGLILLEMFKLDIQNKLVKDYKIPSRNRDKLADIQERQEFLDAVNKIKYFYNTSRDYYRTEASLFSEWENLFNIRTEIQEKSNYENYIKHMTEYSAREMLKFDYGLFTQDGTKILKRDLNLGYGINRKYILSNHRFYCHVIAKGNLDDKDPNNVCKARLSFNYLEKYFFIEMVESSKNGFESIQIASFPLVGFPLEKHADFEGHVVSLQNNTGKMEIRYAVLTRKIFRVEPHSLSSESEIKSISIPNHIQDLFLERENLGIPRRALTSLLYTIDRFKSFERRKTDIFRENNVPTKRKKEPNFDDDEYWDQDYK